MIQRVPGLRSFGNPRFQLVVAVVFLFAAVVIHIQVLLTARTALYDFHDLVDSARVMLSGQTPYQPLDVAPAGLSTFGPLHSNYPPTAYLFVAALTVASGAGLDLAWMGLSELLLAGTVVMIYMGVGRPSAVEAVLAVALTLFAFPVLNNMFWGQINLVTLFLLVAAVLAAQRGRPVLGGAALALAIAIKLTPAALMPYFAWKRNWKLLAATVITFAVLVGLTVLVGWGSRWAEYFTFAGPSSRGTAMFGNQSINGVLLRLWHPELSGFPIGPLDTGFTLAWYGVEALVVGILLLSLRGARLAGPMRGWTEVALILLALPLVQPVAWFHHHVFAVVAIVVGVRLVRLRLLPAPAVAALVVAYVLASPLAIAVAIRATPVQTAFSLAGVLASVMVLGSLVAIVALGRTRSTSLLAPA